MSGSTCSTNWTADGPSAAPVMLSAKAGPSAEARVGNALPIANIPLGTTIHNIELIPGKGGQIVRSAGASAQLLAKEGDQAQVRLPSGEVMWTTAGSGVIHNEDVEPFGKTRIGIYTSGPPSMLTKWSSTSNSIAIAFSPSAACAGADRACRASVGDGSHPALALPANGTPRRSCYVNGVREEREGHGQHHDPDDLLLKSINEASENLNIFVKSATHKLLKARKLACNGVSSRAARCMR